MNFHVESISKFYRPINDERVMPFRQIAEVKVTVVIRLDNFDKRHLVKAMHGPAVFVQAESYIVSGYMKSYPARPSAVRSYYASTKASDLVKIANSPGARVGNVDTGQKCS